MGTRKTNTTVNQMLQEFEELAPITPSEDWEANLNIKLQLTTYRKKSTINYYSILLVVLTVINVAFIYVSSSRVNEKKVSKDEVYQKLTNELLITSNN